MARPKFHHQYPPVFRDTLDDIAEVTALGKEDPIEVVFDTLAAAKSFRLDFYSYTAAIARDAEMMLPKNYPFAPTLTVRVLDNPPRVNIFPRSGTDASKRLEAVLAERKAKRLAEKESMVTPEEVADAWEEFAGNNKGLIKRVGEMGAMPDFYSERFAKKVGHTTFLPLFVQGLTLAQIRKEEREEEEKERGESSLYPTPPNDESTE